MPPQVLRQFLAASLTLTRQRYERIRGWLDQHLERVHRDGDAALKQNALAGIVVSVEGIALIAANTIARLFNFGGRRMLRRGQLNALEQSYAADGITAAGYNISRRQFRNRLENGWAPA